MSGKSQDRVAKEGSSKPPKARLAAEPRSTTKPDLKGLLLTPEVRTDALAPPRPERRHRGPLE